ncbi:hypothetical protein MGAST_07325 [Mycobacterium gastri 'Wayne']|nr:hypothetical protein MGAST_07325 [Mycobacterium gastri 'Wayne']
MLVLVVASAAALVVRPVAWLVLVLVVRPVA